MLCVRTFCVRTLHARAQNALTFSLLALFLAAFTPLVAFAGDAGSAAAQAEVPGSSAIGIVPADGQPRGIRLRAQTVATVISEDTAGVWADTTLEVQLQNRGKTAIILPVGIPGPQVAAYVTSTLALPPISDVTVDNKALILEPAANPKQPAVRASAVITIPAQATVALRLRYRQAVPVRDDLAAYAFPLQSGNVWAGAAESLSVSLTFKVPVADEQLLYLTPSARTPRPGTYAWSWMGVKAPANILVAFVTSEWWRGLKAARTAAAAPGAGLAESAVLGEKYWRLATLAPPAFAAGSSLYDRSLPLAVAAWRAGIAAAGADTPKPELARARERLAGLYLAEASHTEHDRAQVYLQMAVNELAAAVQLDPSDADRVASATTLQASLAAAAAGRGNGEVAAAHLARMQAIAAGRAAPAPEQETQERTLALAEAAANSSDLASARQLLQETFGPEVLALPDARPPSVTQVLLTIATRPAGRQISLNLVDADQGRSAAELIRETAEALQRVAPVLSAGTGLTVTLAYTDPAELVAAQARLAAALPRLPELALVSSALTSRRLGWPEEANLVARTSRYEERVDLASCAAAWNAEADKLEAAAADAAGSGDRLDALRASLWRADGRAWRDLAALSRVTYLVALQERGAGPEWLQARVHQLYREGSVEREWIVRAGETRQLEAAILGWRYDRLAMAAGAALLLAALAAGLIWLVAR